MRPSTNSIMFAVTAAILAMPHCVQAVNKHWNVASGVWGAAGDWSPSGVPAPADDVFVDHFANGSAGVVAINSTSTGAVTSVTVLNGGTVSLSDSRGGVGTLLCGTDFVV